MTLLDASVIIDVLRSKDAQLLQSMMSANGAVCGVTRAEILSGARGSTDQAKLVAILDRFQQVEIPATMWDEVGTVQAELRANGITVPLADAVLIAVALSLDIEIWARDRHFVHAQHIRPALRLFRESA
jgi:predicted nucleic acid-binding protein